MGIFLLLVCAFVALGIYQSYTNTKRRKALMLEYAALPRTLDNFTVDTSYTHPNGNCFIALDIQHRKFIFAGKLSPDRTKTLKKGPNPRIIWHRVVPFNDIVKSEILVDDQLVSSKGVGRAIAGGLLFGGVGAIVGSTTGKTKFNKVVETIKLKVLVNDVLQPACEMVFFIKFPDKRLMKAADAKDICQAWQDKIYVVTTN